MRVMGACNELRFRKQTKAAIIIQVKIWKYYKIKSSYFGGFLSYMFPI